MRELASPELIETFTTLIDFQTCQIEIDSVIFEAEIIIDLLPDLFGEVQEVAASGSWARRQEVHLQS